MPSEHPDPELAGYRPVNGWAIAALLLGVAAPLAFADPLLWWVPLVGIAIAIVALARIRRSDLPTVGRKAAIFGLILSAMIATAAPARYLTRNYWLVARSEELANRWFDRLRDGQTQAAFDLMFHVPPRHVPPPHEAAHEGAHEGTAASAAPPEKAELDSFLARPPVPRLLALGDRLQRKRVQTSVMPENMGRQTVSLWYQIDVADEHPLKPLIVQLETQRRIDPDGQERWWIQNIWGSP
jgi:hypothetical protein